MNAATFPEQSAAEYAWWLALADVGGLGWSAYAQLLDRYGTPQDALEAIVGGKFKSGRIDAGCARQIRGDMERYLALVARCSALGVAIVRCIDDGYPRNIKVLAPKPPFLYRKGTYGAPDERCAALVGSLTPSDDGVKRARRLAKLLVEKGFTIVSGLARGIDTASHKAALEAGGRTLAVVGTGLDTVYPPENGDLAAQIEAHGAVFSQFPLGAKPQRHTFPKRNQVMSALSMATILVEAHADCGSVIQAGYAFQQGRQVYLLKSNLDQGDNGWAKELVAKGAIVVHDIDDILRTIRAPLAAAPAVQKPPATVTQSPQRAIQIAIETGTDAGEPCGEGAAVAVLFDLEGTLFDALPVMSAAYRQVLSQHYNISVSAEEMAPLLRESPYAVLGRWLQPEQVKQANKLYDQVYPSCLAQHARLFDGVEQLADKLCRGGYHTGIVTSQTRRRAQAVVAMFPALQQIARVLVTWDDVKARKKPNPYPIELALSKLNVTPAAVYYVGDSASDIDAGHGAGAKTVAVAWGLTPLDVLVQRRPEFTIQSVPELLEVLPHSS